jgi:hypothetical protein
MEISIKLLFLIMMLLSTLFYSYNNDKSMFLFVLLLIAIFLYVEEYLENKINNVLIKPIEKLENIYDSIINRIKNI